LAHAVTHADDMETPDNEWERDAARRRAHDLERWQQEFKARSIMGYTIWIADEIPKTEPQGFRWRPWREHLTFRNYWPLDPPAKATAHRIAFELRQLLSRPHGKGALVAVRLATAGAPLLPEQMADYYNDPLYIND